MPAVVTIRARTEGDYLPLEAIVEESHRHDDYPTHLPELGGGHFLFNHPNLGAWVAEVEGHVAGHVALHPHTADSVMEVAEESVSHQANGIAVVARLVVSQQYRRRGLAAALLRRASREAFALERWPMLDVAAHLKTSMAVYEHLGWSRVGATKIERRDGSSLRVFVYMAPPPGPWLD